MTEHHRAKLEALEELLQILDYDEEAELVADTVRFIDNIIGVTLLQRAQLDKMQAGMMDYEDECGIDLY